MSPYNDGSFNPKLVPHLLYQPPSTIPNAQHPPLPPDDSAYNMTHKYNNHVVRAEGDAFDANMEPEHDTVIKQLTCELVVSDDAMGSWAE